MVNPTLKRVKGDGIEINLALWEGESEPVVAIHGITANCRSFDMIASDLSPGFSVAAMDLRGRGLSDRPQSGYSLEHHAKDILAVLDELGVDKVKLMGHSLGAFITLGFAAMHPERVEKAVLIDGAGDLSKEQLDNVFVGIKPAFDRLNMVFPSRDAYIDKMRSAPYMQPWSDLIELYYDYEIESCEGGVRTNIRSDHIGEEAANVRKIDCKSLYPKVKAPVLILKATEGLFNENDLLLPEDVVARMVSEIPNVVRFDVEGTNHYGIVFQAHDERDRILREFLR